MHWTEVVAIVIIVLAVVPVLIGFGLLLFQWRAGRIKFEQRTVPGFGEFQVLAAAGVWVGNCEHSELGEVGLCFMTNKKSVPEAMLRMARDVFERLPELVPTAVTYYQGQPDAIALTADQFESVYLPDDTDIAYDDQEKPFSLMFEVDDEHETLVTVDFQDFQPMAYDCGD